MNQLVAQYVVGLLQWTRKGQYDTPLQRLGGSTCALAWRPAELGGLLEVRMTGVIHDGLPATQLVVQQPR